MLAAHAGEGRGWVMKSVVSTIRAHILTGGCLEFDRSWEGRWEYLAGRDDGHGWRRPGAQSDCLEHDTRARRPTGRSRVQSVSSDMRLKVPKAFPYRYPDVVVLCDEPILEELQGQQMLVNPLLMLRSLASMKGMTVA